ncbi:MAG: hypothetical protein H8E15_16450 [Planctomycetes bacterium]|nr:hypothetical protein [Planctomycetota bacterium]
MNQAWVHVYSGSYSSVLANQASLEASGIQTFVPDTMTKMVDPFITGGNPMGAELLVLESDLEAASELLGDRDSQTSSPDLVQQVWKDPFNRVLFIIAGVIAVIAILGSLFA